MTRRVQDAGSGTQFRLLLGLSVSRWVMIIVKLLLTVVITSRREQSHEGLLMRFESSRHRVAAADLAQQYRRRGLSLRKTADRLQFDGVFLTPPGVRYLLRTNGGDPAQAKYGQGRRE